MLDKRGIMDELPKWIIALLFLVIAIIILASVKGSLSGGLMELFSFR